MSALAVALEHNAETGRPVFPCAETKAPTCPRGFYAASSEPKGIRDLWRRYPGPLVGVPTGLPSGLSVLDIDATKHPEAAAWFWKNKTRLETRTVETRSGGWHCFFRHSTGLKSAVALLGFPGVDVRGERGFVISWEAHGFKTLSDAAVAPWPVWLTRQHEPSPARAPDPPRVPDDASIGALIAWVARSREGERNSRTYWAGRRLAEMVSANMMSMAYAAALIERAGMSAGLSQVEAHNTAQSALTGGKK